MGKPHTYKSATHINKQIKLMGLDGYQVLILLVTLVISFFISMLLPVILLIPVIYILSKINSEIKKGNPSPVNSYLLKYKVKRRITDNANVLLMLHQNGIKDENSELE